MSFYLGENNFLTKSEIHFSIEGSPKRIKYFAFWIFRVEVLHIKPLLQKQHFCSATGNRGRKGSADEMKWLSLCVTLCVTGNPFPCGVPGTSSPLEELRYKLLGRTFPIVWLSSWGGHRAQTIATVMPQQRVSVWRSRQWQKHAKIQRTLKAAPPNLRVSLSAALQERAQPAVAQPRTQSSPLPFPAPAVGRGISPRAKFAFPAAALPLSKADRR